MNHYLVLAIYCLAVAGSSLLGGAIPSLVRLTHVRMQCLLSLVGGFVLGVALLHMIPHGVAACGSLDLVIRWTLIGLLFTFFMIRLFHFHQHGPETQPRDDGQECSDPAHDHHHHDHAGSEVGWTGVLLGLSLHSLMDGIAMATAVLVDHSLHGGEAHGWPYGFGVFLAVLLHKPLDALSIAGLMISDNWSAQARRRVNILYAFVCPLGALLFLAVSGLAVREWANWPSLLGLSLGFSAGAFLCISLSDLLPEVQFHRHDRVKLSISLLLGVALAYGIGFLESPDAHHHHHATPAETHSDHEGHSH